MKNRLRTFDSQEYGTPQFLFDKLNEEFHFTLDPAASPSNAKCPIFVTKEEDGLSYLWKKARVFVNPPYNDIKPWLVKAMEDEPEIAVFLLPARTHTDWFHEIVLRNKLEIRWVRKKLHFEGGPYNSPEPSMIVICRGRMSI